MDEVVELLFKFRPVVFEKGRLAFAGGASLPVLGTIAAVLALVAALTYRRVRASSTPRDRIALTSLRVALLALVLLCLARPVIVLSAAVPQRRLPGSGCPTRACRSNWSTA